ncbi:hypothetical protein DHEL01_v201316 [Diaporthe helianthi]|uniref:Uncharacterized protein n=1 Tax=Diaporthe helianthi TaxID=158607 RepID=A0A2P5ICQ7_DIAHE|nr:hypothetical protein DHEL01_v201316 [Diaporthe helianthi]
MSEKPQAKGGAAAAPKPPAGGTGAGAGAGVGAGASTAGLPMAEITQAAEAAKAAARFQDVADALKKQAALVRDPAERERLWQAAYAKEKEAHGESKKARLMASGWGQGTGLGIGISSAVGMGLGNLVGALLSGVVAVPGSLIGAGVGAIHGPWYKFSESVTGGGGTKADEDAGHDRLGKDINKSQSGGGDKGGNETDDSGMDDEAHKRIVDAAKKLEEEEKGKSG